jgi:hypothetical protein
MCGNALAASTGAVEAKGHWFCSREHRLTFEGGLTGAAGTPCQQSVANARKYDIFLVGGSGHVRRNCRSDPFMAADSGLTVRARECVVYTTVGRNLLSTVGGKRVVTYPETQIALFLAHEKRGWRVVLEDTGKTTTSGSNTAPPEWARRVPHTSQTRAQLTICCSATPRIGSSSVRP